jgi:diguanylate cyclase (GGDEF)-like protein
MLIPNDQISQLPDDLLDALHESIQLWDLNGRVLFCNAATCQLFETNDETLHDWQEVSLQWTFFSETNTSLKTDPLLIERCAETGHPQSSQILKMVQDDHAKWIVSHAVPMTDDKGELYAVATTIFDITRYKSEEQKYKNIANYDPLTKLPNRSLMADRLELAISHANRNKSSLAVCLIDLDGFKEVNDRFGHEAGDQVLVEASRRMRDAVRGDDTVARLGGDEFVIILTDLGKSEECAVSLYRILNALSQPYSIAEHTIESVSASIGVSLYPDDKVEADTLLRHADVAMYKSKNSGKNKFSFFDVTSDQKIKANYRTINKIKKALEASQFHLYYQPKINALSSEILEVEALARWEHPLLGVVSPAEFLPLIENDEELCEIFDKWVISESIRQLHTWQKERFFLKICINISPRQFKSRKFVNWLKEVIDETGAPMELLTFLEVEILETAAVESLVRSNEIINECKKLGLTFALDDFGTGYSSLMHLKDLKVDTIKIDKLFVGGMLENTANMVIVQAVIALANAFDITVTAEGAESIEHVMSLLEMGCDAIQGYAIARPMPVEEVRGFVEAFVPDPRWKMASHLLPSKADFELLLASSNHKYWMERVFRAFETGVFDEEEVFRDQNICRFGRWFVKAREKKYKETKSFNELDRVHREIHGKVAALLDRIRNEQRSATPEELTAIHALSHHLLESLERVRKEIDAMKQKSNLINKIMEKRRKFGNH